MVMEGERHAVPYAAFDNRLMDGVDELAALGVAQPPHLGGSLYIFLVVIYVAASENVTACGSHYFFGYIAANCVDHTKSPL